MRELPAGIELLDIAHDTLRNSILPQLSDDSRYLGLMVLNAISIARRQLVLDERPVAQELEALAALLKVSALKGEPQAATNELERELVKRLREGAYDNDEAGQRALWDITVARVRESAPRALGSKGE